jgi:hypothetical protein
MAAGLPMAVLAVLPSCARGAHQVFAFLDIAVARNPLYASLASRSWVWERLTRRDWRVSHIAASQPLRQNRELVQSLSNAMRFRP